MTRVVLHIDMDAFFAAIEQRDQPHLRGKPVLVGGRNRRGVVTTASYEARPFGCRSAMPMAQALRLCPHADVVPVRHEHYRAVSQQLRAIFHEFTPVVEPLSIDEAFLDVTGSQQLLGDGPAIAAKLKARVFAETQLTASIGVAPNKFVAKLASDLDKPNGLTQAPRDADDVAAWLAPLPIERLWGAGPRTQQRLTSLGVFTFGDAQQLSAERLAARFGATGERFYSLVRGIDDRPVITDRAAKSISHEHTFPRDIADLDALRGILLDQLEQVAQRLRAARRLARTVSLKLRNGRFQTRSRRITLTRATNETAVLWRAARTLFDDWAQQPQPLRLLGVGVSGLSDSNRVSELSVGVGEQLELFGRDETARGQRLDATVDAIRSRFGEQALVRGAAYQANKSQSNDK